MQRRRRGQVNARRDQVVEMQQLLANGDAHEAAGSQVFVDHRVRDLGRTDEGAGHRESSADWQHHRDVGDRLYGVGTQFAVAYAAMGAAHARPEQTQIIVDFGRGAHRRARRPRRILLLDGHGG